MSRAEGGGDFYALPEAEQIRGLEQLANEALGHWDLTGAKLRTAAYRENMTFRVEAGERGRFALRVHQAGYRSDAEIRSELAFMSVLREHGVLTPEVVPAGDGSPFVVSGCPAVPEPRQCDLFEWIDGRPLRAAGETTTLSPDILSSAYERVGQQAAAIANIAERWQPPAGFSRPVWDAEGMFGKGALLGDWRKSPILTGDQRDHFERLADKLGQDLAAFGQTPDRFGLCHGDYLPENLMISDEGLRLLDFDDCGPSWYLFDFATALFDLIGEPPFEPCLAAMLTGYRSARPLPEDHLAHLPSFFLARALSYLGWTATRSHLDRAHRLAPRLIEALTALTP